MMRPWMVLLASLLTASASALAAPEPAAPTAEERAPASTGASERLGQSYILMTRAEQSWQAGDPAKAAGDYGAALDILEALERDYPGWASHIVRSRILTCESAMDKLRQGKAFETEPAGEAAPADDLKDIPFALSAASEETALKALKAGLVERDAALADCRDELLALKKANTAMANRLAQLEGKPPGAEAQSIPTVLKSQARQLLAAGANSNAVALLTEMKGLYEKDEGVRHLLATAYCRMGAFSDAVREVEPLVKRGRASADVWLTLGVAYMGTGNLGKARQAIEEGLDLDPNLPEAHFNMAQILIRLEKPDADLARRHYMAGIQLGAERDGDLEMAINQALMNEQARKLKH